MHFLSALSIILPAVSCLPNGHSGVLDHDSITALPLAERWPAYRDTDPDSQARLWTERIEQYYKMNNDISSDQHDVLQRFVKAVEQHVEMKKKDDEGGMNRDLDNIVDDAIAAFGPDGATLVFGTFGRLDGKDSASLSVEGFGNQKKVPMGNNGKSLDDRAAEAPCTCGGFPTCIGHKCYSDEESACAHTPDGCGAGGYQSCTGICV